LGAHAFSAFLGALLLGMHYYYAVSMSACGPHRWCPLNELSELRIESLQGVGALQRLLMPAIPQNQARQWHATYNQPGAEHTVHVIRCFDIIVTSVGTWS
jgi:hypothetical protein